MTQWLIDKSALVRIGLAADAADWADRTERGLVRVSTLTRLEVGCSARSGAELREGRGFRIAVRRGGRTERAGGSPPSEADGWAVPPIGQQG